MGADDVDRGAREHYADAALYDYEYRRRRADVTFYRALAKQRGATRVLAELGCGSGRLTVPLARDGAHRRDRARPVAPDARAAARQAKLPPSVARRITTVEADLCTFELGEKFPLAIAAFNVMEHLYTRGEFHACLHRVAAHLAPGGAFAFDVQLPDLEWLIRDPTKRWAKTRFTDPTTRRPMFYSTNHVYDPVSQIVLIRLYYDPVEGGRGGRVVTLSQRKFFPAELEALVAGADFAVSARYGDFFSRPLDGHLREPGPEVVRTSSEIGEIVSVTSTGNSRFPSRI